LGDNVVVLDEETGAFLATLVPSSSGLIAPSALAFGPDGNLYVASGDREDNSAILRFDPSSGRYIDTFVPVGQGLAQPTGLAFGPDGLLYVSSYLTDQILRFDASTGAFVDIFASGTGKAGGVNGPNQLLFGPDGLLYVTTVGSVAIGGQPTFPGLPSQVLRFNIINRASEVFIDAPTPAPDAAGLRLQGLAFGPACATQGGACDLFVSDFFDGIRRYDAVTRQLKATLDPAPLGTTPRDGRLGGLTFGADQRLYTVGFDAASQSGNPGSVLRFSGQDNLPLPAPGQSGALFVGPSTQLPRPLGILYQRRPTS
jgi:DNA-binding beta-propeller fold protein YncE